MHSTIAAQEAAEIHRPLRASGPHKSRQLFHILLILAVWAVLYIPSLSSPALLDDADSVHAEAAREMVLRHDWSTLYINGFRYLEKAPLMYWGMALSYKLFGVSEWTARLPLALGMLALLFAIYAFGRRYFSEKAGLYSAVAMATGFGPYIFTRILIPDVLVGLFLLVGFHYFLRGLEEETPSRISCWAFAIAAALNVLTKGLIGIVFPVGIILAFLFLTGNLKHLLRMRLVSSLLIFLAIAAPWHILAGINNPAQGESRGFFWFYFINEHVLRYLNKRFPKDYDTVPFALFWGMILVWLMPWSAFLFKAVAQVPLRWRELLGGWSRGVKQGWQGMQDYGHRLDSRGRAALLCALWALVILVFFSFSSRQEYYTIPALPGLALLIGAWLGDEDDSPVGSPLRRAGRRITGVMFGIAIPAFLVSGALLWFSEAVAPDADLANILTKNPEKYALSFGHIFDLTPQAMGMFRWPLGMTAVALLLGTFFGWWLRRRGSAAMANVALTLMMIVFLHSAHSALKIFEPVLSSKRLSMAVSKVYKPGDIVVVNGAYEDGSTLNFYGHFQLHVINSRLNGNLYYGSLFPDSPKIFETDESFLRLWRGEKRVFLWAEEQNLPASLRDTQYTVVATSGGKLILSNQPNR